MTDSFPAPRISPEIHGAGDFMAPVSGIGTERGEESSRDAADDGTVSPRPPGSFCAGQFFRIRRCRMENPRGERAGAARIRSDWRRVFPDGSSVTLRRRGKRRTQSGCSGENRELGRFPTDSGAVRAEKKKTGSAGNLSRMPA